MKKSFFGIFYASLFMSFVVSLTVGAVHAEEYLLHQTGVVSLGNNDRGIGVALDADRNMYLAMRLGDRGQEINALIKYTPFSPGLAGGISWWQYAQYGDPQEMKAVAADALGNVYVTGRTTTDEGDACYTEAYDPQGAPLWSQTFPGGYANWCSDIVVDATTITVAGTYKSSDSTTQSILLIKYDAATGAELCSVTTNWSSPSATSGQAIDVDATGNTYVLGSTSDGVFKYNSLCEETGGPGPDMELPGSAYSYSDIAVNSQGMIYVLGNDTSDIHLVKFDGSGTLIDAVTYNSGGNDKGNALALDAEDNVYVAGQANSYIIVKYDSLLNLLWSGSWNSGGTTIETPLGDVLSEPSDQALAIGVDADERIYVTGTAGGVIDSDGTLEYNAVTLIYSQELPPPPPDYKKRK